VLAYESGRQQEVLPGNWQGGRGVLLPGVSVVADGAAGSGTPRQENGRGGRQAAGGTVVQWWWQAGSVVEAGGMAEWYPAVAAAGAGPAVVPRDQAAPSRRAGASQAARRREAQQRQKSSSADAGGSGGVHPSQAERHPGAYAKTHPRQLWRVRQWRRVCCLWHCLSRVGEAQWKWFVSRQAWPAGAIQAAVKAQQGGKRPPTRVRTGAGSGGARQKCIQRRRVV